MRITKQKYEKTKTMLYAWKKVWPKPQLRPVNGKTFNKSAKKQKSTFFQSLHIDNVNYMHEGIKEQTEGDKLNNKTDKFHISERN